MSEISSQSESTAEADKLSPIITLRALVLGALTIAVTFYSILHIVERLGLGSYVRSQFPMAAFVPFVLWLFLNTLLKRLWPRVALSRGELLTIFAMLWVVGTLPQYGWMNTWTAIMATPRYHATPENRWAETLFEYLPWHVFAATESRVTETFWFGLPEGMALPWDGWASAIFQWLSVSFAMVVFGFCLIALFQRQWADSEKLTFPLAQMPLDLTQGMDGARRMPDLFRAPLFWIGFGVVFLPILYNIGTYFVFGLPPFELFGEFYFIEFGHYARLAFRLMPLVLAVAYLCPVDILGSLWVFNLLHVLKLWIGNRMGFSIGAQGQAMVTWHLISMEAYGAMIFVACWSIWLARRHLRQVLYLVRSGRGDPREIVHYRIILIGLVLSAAYVVGWAVSLGMNLFVALGSFTLMSLAYLAITKLVAATGFAYLFPRFTKGEPVIVDLVGSVYLAPRTLVAFKVFSSSAFFGNTLIPAWPALPHILRIFSLRRQPRWVAAVVFVAFPVGFLVSAGATIELSYDEGGAVLLGGQGSGLFDRMVHLLENPRVPDMGKGSIMLLGWVEGAAIAFMRSRFHWFPFHPIGLAFQNGLGTRAYWFSLFVVWAIKLTLLRYGGIKAFRAGKPFFYGLGIGYVVGVVLSGGVDLIWFPVEGHEVHRW